MVFRYAKYTGYEMRCRVHTKNYCTTGCVFGDVRRPACSLVSTDELFDSMCMWDRHENKWKMYGFVAFLEYIGKVGVMHTELGYLHRDLKPGNMLIRTDGIRGACSDMELIDFGNSMKIGKNTHWGSTAVFSELEGFFPPEICSLDVKDHANCTAWPEPVRRIFKRLYKSKNDSNSSVCIGIVKELDTAFKGMRGSTLEPSLDESLREMSKRLVDIIRVYSNPHGGVAKSPLDIIEQVKVAVQMNCSVPTDVYALVRTAAVILNFMIDGVSKKIRNSRHAGYDQLRIYERKWRCG